METSLNYTPVHIEFLGTPGSGKTTLLSALANFLKANQLQPYTVLEAARPFALRTRAGRAVNTLAPMPFRRALLWQVFYMNSLISRASFISQHKSLIQQVTDHQRQRPKEAGVQERGVLHWFYHLAGYYEFLKSRIKPSEVLLFDDGFVHRVVHLFASEIEEPDVPRITTYLELIPKPDLIIIPSTPLALCEQRVHDRGLWKHSQHKSIEQVKNYLANAERVVQITTDYLQEQGWPVVHLENGDRNQDQVAEDLYRKLENLRLFTNGANRKDVKHQQGTLARHFFHMPRPSRVWGFIRSKQRPLDIDLQMIEQVLLSFDLEMSGTPENLPLSRRTQNILVPTHDGKKVLKKYRPMLPNDTIQYSHSILEALQKVNFPAIRLAEDRSGQTSISYAGASYAISTFVEGASYSSSFLWRSQRLQIMAMAGQNLAQFHRALHQFIPSGKHHLGFNTLTGEWQRGAEWYAAKVNEMQKASEAVNCDPDRNYLDWMDKNCIHILDEMTALDEMLRQAPLPRLIIHGDYGLHNLVFPKDGLVTMLDFETARLEWRLSDLVSALSRLRFRNGRYDFETISAFLSAYQAEYPMGKEEWDWLPKVWRFYKLRSSLIYWNSYLDTGGPVRKLISAQDAVHQANWVIQNPERLLNLIPQLEEAV